MSLRIEPRHRHSEALRRSLALAACIASVSAMLWSLFTILRVLIKGGGHGTVYWGAIALIVLVTVGLGFAAARSWAGFRK